MGGLFARNARRYPDVMNAMSMPAAPAPRSVGLREVGQRAGEIYREVESSGVPVTVTDDGRPIAQIVPIRREESWYERMVRQGQVRPAKHPSGCRRSAMPSPKKLTSTISFSASVWKTGDLRRYVSSVTGSSWSGGRCLGPGFS